MPLPVPQLPPQQVPTLGDTPVGLNSHAPKAGTTIVEVGIFKFKFKSHKHISSNQVQGIDMCKGDQGGTGGGKSQHAPLGSLQPPPPAPGNTKSPPTATTTKGHNNKEKLPLITTRGATVKGEAGKFTHTKVNSISSKGTTIYKLKPPTYKQSKRKQYTKQIKTLISNDHSFQTKILNYIQKTRPETDENPSYESSECEVEIGGPGNCQSGQNHRSTHKRVSDPKNESMSKVILKGAKDGHGDKDPVTTVAVYKPILFYS